MIHHRDPGDENTIGRTGIVKFDGIYHKRDGIPEEQRWAWIERRIGPRLTQLLADGKPSLVRLDRRTAEWAPAGFAVAEPDYVRYQIRAIIVLADSRDAQVGDTVQPSEIGPTNQEIPIGSVWAKATVIHARVEGLDEFAISSPVHTRWQRNAYGWERIE